MPKKLLYPLSAIMLVAVGLLLGFNLKIETDQQRSLRKVEEVYKKVAENYFEDVDHDKMSEDAIKGMLDGLDPHTFYIPPKDMQEVSESMQGAFEGIGIQFNLLEDTLYVVAALNGGPSEKVGIRAGDKIVKVDGEVIAGVGIDNEDVMRLLRGKKGTKVTVSVKRGKSKQLIDFDIIRDKIPLYAVDYSYMIDKETGYIRVNRFSSTTTREFIEHLHELKKEGLKNLILDLRNNPGGYLQEATRLSDFFLDKGKLIVYTEGRIPSSKSRHEAGSRINDFEKGGLVILINQGSASASEIVSGSVQDHDRGIIVGRRSFGKGLVQQQYTLSDGSAIRVVVSRYYTPSGRCIQKPYSDDSEEYHKELYERHKSGEIYDESKIDFPDSLKFKTTSGRTVYGGGGIMPDVFVATDTTDDSEYLRNLIKERVFSTFSFRYKEAHPELKGQYGDGHSYAQKFKVDKALINEFTAYAADHGVPYKEDDYIASERFIRYQVKASIGRAFFGDDGYYPVILQNDDDFIKAMEMMPAAIRLSKTGKFSLK